MASRHSVQSRQSAGGQADGPQQPALSHVTLQDLLNCPAQLLLLCPLTLKHTNQYTWVTLPLVGNPDLSSQVRNGDAIPNVISLGADLL